MSRRVTTDTFPLPARDYLPYLARDVADVERILRTGELTAPVPSCGTWTLRDLGEHIGGVYRWAAAVVRSGEMCRETFTPGADVAQWYADGAAELLTELRAADPDRPCWHFGTAPRTAAFWFRRQAQETTVHLIDARVAIGGSAWADPLLAADGVDEALVQFLPRTQKRSGAVPVPCGILLRAADTGHAWLVSPGADGATARLAKDEDTADSTITADALELLLLLWKRRGLAGTTARIDGDTDAAHAFLTATLTP